MSVFSKAMIIIAAVLAFSASESQAVWVRLLSDDFSSNTWTYAGVSNALGQALIRPDTLQQRMAAEWDQGNAYSGAGDPQTIINSRCSKPVGRTLTDRDTFRFGATIRIAAGSVPNTLEFYQIANFGLYNLAADVVGADRMQSDNYSGNMNLVRDANDLIEFNYFINNRSFGDNPSIQGVGIARMLAGEADSSAYWTFGSHTDPMFHDTDMGADNYLPVDSNLYAEIVYYGRETNATRRRVCTAIYTDAARTNLLTVNGVAMYYWTKPVASNLSFDVDQVGLFNYAGVNYTGSSNGTGSGSYDDVYVDLWQDAGELYTADRSGPGVVLTWASQPGTNYYVVALTNLLSNSWVTQAVVQATGPLTTWTGQTAGVSATYGVRY